ncbi:hypothetical protein [Spirosoma radiotolerans]|uniref:Uncharacterized protein n=1 Tax=Spirosoma radiotolerans TaxID=1379870 RepID=A0A0E3V5E0_9BACT|nr:hypothetical protein [Spirosoma radiotolerans]AKD54072.1 hypothetical protein SD10_03320 [Spirosoma radiotolerans]
MALTDVELKCLRYDLVELAHIDYTDVLNELLDHYATLTEQKMATGLSFDDASKWAWAELGAGKGLQAVQRNYADSTRKYLKNRHLAIVKSYFRWPAIVVTLLVSVLIYQLLAVMTPTASNVAFAILLLSPCLALTYIFVNGGSEYDNRQKLAWRYLKQQANLPMTLISLSNCFSDEYKSGFLPLTAAFASVFCIAYLLYAVSLFQLSREQFRTILT